MGIKFNSWNSQNHFLYHCSFTSNNKIELILMPTIQNCCFLVTYVFLIKTALNQCEIKSKAPQNQRKRVEEKQQTKYDPNVLNRALIQGKICNTNYWAVVLKLSINTQSSTMISSTCSGLTVWFFGLHGLFCSRCVEWKKWWKNMIAKV